MMFLTVNASVWGCPWCRVLHKATGSTSWRASTPVWIHLSSLNASTWLAIQTQHNKAHKALAFSCNFRVHAESQLLSCHEIPAAPTPSDSPKAERINWFVAYGLMRVFSRWIYWGGMCTATPGVLSTAVLTLGQITGVLCALFPPYSISAAALVLRRFSQSLWREKRAACVLFLLSVLSPFLPPPISRKFVPFLVMALCSFTIKVIHQRDRAVFSACLPERYSWLWELHSLSLMSSYMVLGAFPTPSIPLTAQTLWVEWWEQNW